MKTEPVSADLRFPVVKQVERVRVVQAVEVAISRAGSAMSADQTSKLRTVALDSSHLAVGSASLEHPETGAEINCPLVLAGLWEDDTAAVKANALWRFYRSFDTTMGPGFVVVEVTD